MGMRINTNTAAMNAYRNLSVNDSQMSKSLEKLSSGFRINRAADDAAGLAISEGLRSQIGGLKVAVRNAQDGVSVVQTAEGALAETTSILQRMRDLSVQASNDGGLSTAAKGNLQAEINQLNSELNRIASSTSFNGKKLLDGSYTGNFQVGANSGEVISIAIGSNGAGMDATGLGVAGIDLTGVGAFSSAAASGTASTVFTTNATSAAAATVAFTSSSAANSAFASGASATDAAAISEFAALDGTISVGGKSFNLATVDYAGVTTAADALTKLNSAVDAALGNVGSFTAAGNQLTFTMTDDAASSSAADIAKATPVFTAGSGADAAIAKLDDAISKVSTQRANLGAIQNRFEHTIANLNTAVENLSESESRIRDTDMASEMTNFSKNQILVQAGTAMLAQANSSSQSVLKLLQ
ncbi:flagellin N-terminal helical domain-containing protein [Klenkia taihuensis]|uniref:Flagellin n=1 Tax=Klenkia taihuensis TaxID=1225127 RepID=A0A1I1MR82_9ACTN|nr:flagellin [Klenkia taihuensis]GHE14329.1 flagellin [Klenkia taihuensis]SFC85678.1 flagellin [Klenkia taihuensis]